MNINVNKIGLNFDNSYSNLSKILMTEIEPSPVKSPKLIILNHELAENLNLDFNLIEETKIALLLSGNNLPKGSKSIAQAYAGHQFGYFTMLGDGRATLMGEHINSDNKRFDIQFKGSGRTPYSRNGDGRATLVSMLREYLISEAMHSLAIPTTRSLSVVSTGENVQREKLYMGGILTRVATSHIRVGTFQYLNMRGDVKTLKDLVNYCLNRHYPENPIDTNPAITLLKLVINKQISLIVNWMRVGFIHGVMNTDNMTISGETIDYGPCAFMEFYDPKTVFSSIDNYGRYSFSNQKIICHWNLSRFAETLLPLISENEGEAIKIGKEIINDFNKKFESEWISMMKNKLGFLGDYPEDINFINKLLIWMEKNKADYTNTFIFFMNGDKISKIYEDKIFIELHKQWKKRISKNNTSKNIYMKIMRENNPFIIPRNHLVEEALKNANEKNNYNKFNQLLNLLKKPYNNNIQFKSYQPPSNIDFLRDYKTYCGT